MIELVQTADEERAGHTRPPVLAINDVVRDFGARRALQGISLELAPGQLHAVLGPNGAGKTTLLRILSGLVDPTSGTVTVWGPDGTIDGRERRAAVALVPSGDRTFYLRLSGFENLLFFARLQGLRKQTATARALSTLSDVGLAGHAHAPVGEYSHGMQKRLSVARALLTAPSIILVDEATHDLDPEGSRIVRRLIREIVDRGTAALWATQRLDEIREFADRVTLLSEGHVRFSGSVGALAAQASPRRHVLRLRRVGGDAPETQSVSAALAGAATVEKLADDADAFRVVLSEGLVLGDALSALSAAGVEILSCREETSEIEEAFLRLAGRE